MSLPTEPYSRIERYLAKLAGQDVDIPDKPITRIECYLAYLCDNGGGGGGGYTPAPNAGAHNAIFRGQSLGTEFTAAQSAAITGGSFEGLYIGDYWTIGGTVYRIAGFNIYLGSGDTPLSSDHIIVVPDLNMTTATMNPTSTTDGGYSGADIRTSVLPTVLSTIETAFGADHILTHRVMLCNRVTDGAPSGGDWVDSKVELMGERQVLGLSVWGSSGYNIGNNYCQFPLFALTPQYISNRSPYWLTDVVNATSFSIVGSRGNINYYSAGGSNIYGVRPYFLIA